MSTVKSAIGEHDEVVLLNPVKRWPAGTRGMVLNEDPDYKIVEMPGIETCAEDEEPDYMPVVPTAILRLV
jgi:hypothetical protein